MFMCVYMRASQELLWDIYSKKPRLYLLLNLSLNPNAYPILGKGKFLPVVPHFWVQSLLIDENTVFLVCSFVCFPIINEMTSMCRAQGRM